jgi:DNA-binding IclR family transcriptional regulator
MKQIKTVDYRILEVLAMKGRNNPANVAAILDQNRPYISVRLSMLAHEGYVTQIGPDPRSRLYELAPDGKDVIKIQ